MQRSVFPILALIATVWLDSSASAQQPRPRTSPHETISAVIDNCRVTIVYGRPYSKSPRGGDVRKIWGTLVPYGQAWRLGSDEATLLVTQQPLSIGETTIPAGAHTLYMVPAENGAKLAFSKTLGGWGIPVDEKNDVARVDMTKETLETPVDQLTMAVMRNPAGGGIIRVMWEGTQYSVPFTIKK
jgi:hypothetical protein